MKKLILLLAFLLTACNFPHPDQPVPETEISPNPDTPCGYVWARKALPELSAQFDAALKVANPQAEGYAQAYGENCVSENGEVIRFSTMETDFYVTLPAQNLEDKEALGEMTAQVLGVVKDFPDQDTPGPQPGYLGITFQAAEDELHLWLEIREAESALDSGLTGEKLFNALQK